VNFGASLKDLGKNGLPSQSLRKKPSGLWKGWRGNNPYAFWSCQMYRSVEKKKGYSQDPFEFFYKLIP
jgi:hypothetical protein